MGGREFGIIARSGGEAQSHQPAVFLFLPFPNKREEAPPENNALPANCQGGVYPVSPGLPGTPGSRRPSLE